VFFRLIPNKNLVHKKLQQTYYAVKKWSASVHDEQSARFYKFWMRNKLPEFINSEWGTNCKIILVLNLEKSSRFCQF
jgi:hypothetical protein